MSTKIKTFSIISVLLLLLTACQSKVRNQQLATEEAGISATPSLSKLLYGALALENTENKLTDEQADSLLFYWKGVRALNNSDNVAAEETAGLTEQIYNTFNDAQKEYISSLDLTADTVQKLSANLSIDATVAEESDITINNGFGGGPMGNGGMTFGGRMPSGGEMPSGTGDMGVMMGGMMMPGQEGLTSEQGQGYQAQLSDVVIEAFINFLKDKLA